MESENRHSEHSEAHSVPALLNTNSNAGSQAKRQLLAFLTDNTAQLLGSIRSYAQRMGLAQGHALTEVAQEILQEVAVEAIASGERFRATGQPMAWLLGIAINVIKRRKVAAAKLYSREVTFGRLAMLLPDVQNEDELFDLIVPFALSDPDSDVEANEQAHLILSLVSQEDQRVLRLAVLYGFEREAIAHELGITPGTARVRLHRALQRLRTAWYELQERQKCQDISKAGERQQR